MVEPVIIRTPIPTPEELADELGVSRSHLAELRRMLEEQGFLRPVAKRSARRKTAVPVIVPARPRKKNASSGQAGRGAGRD